MSPLSSQQHPLACSVGVDAQLQQHFLIASVCVCVLHESGWVGCRALVQGSSVSGVSVRLSLCCAGLGLGSLQAMCCGVVVGDGEQQCWLLCLPPDFVRTVLLLQQATCWVGGWYVMM